MVEMEILEEIEYKGYTIEIYCDEYPDESPRDWETLGTMICFHSRYNLGDEHNYKTPEEFYFDIIGLDEYDYEEYEDYKEAASLKYDEMDQKDIFILDLYLYDHSGITISTTPFSCPWDSGQVGYIYVTKERLKKEGLENKTKEEIYDYLKNEVKIYDDYITGNVYGYTIKEIEDSCWGFYGADHEKSGLLEAAKNSIDCIIDSLKQTKTTCK